MTLARAAGVGAFVLGGFLLFAVALFLIGQRQMLFSRTFTLRTTFARVSGLEPGAPVKVSGMPAGRVTEILVPARPSDHFTVACQVREDLHALVRTDSIASIQTEGLVGGTYLAIAAGSDKAPRAPDGASIASREPFEVSDLLLQMSSTVRMVNETIAALQGDIELAVASVAETAQHADTIIEAVSDDIEVIAQSGARISSDVGEITTALREGHGTIGRLLQDDELYRRATAIARDAQAAVEEARRAVQQGRQAVEDLRRSNGPAQGLLVDLRDTLDRARHAVGALEENAEALKHNFLLRGFFNRRGFFNLGALSPADYRAGALEQDGRRRPLRIWLGAGVLFDQSDGDAVVLTDDGKGRLDSAMAEYLPFLREAPLVVEGYATGGGDVPEFLVSRTRANVVREYLLARFHLDGRHVGAMPLGGDAPGSPNGDRWDGVALAWFVDRAGLDRAGRRRGLESPGSPAPTEP